LLACPLMHVFMHRGHGGHGAGHSGPSVKPTDSNTPAPPGVSAAGDKP
jgi:hypothetical protein